ncbi:hypothetical protein ETAA8_23690 [Anatilimnocola aggregata]|uniref:Uncharacterized protein n=1 Tax=Anatilimnocola aggregata TaxID=2528021 RepID=A0A517YAU3_9BACT|nr:DUF6331 family protein [Anatilimnocola aggregata]QDU27282.1 hypothetical protein ETAA8_23690 [Anatilimnocola aggregata]
MAKKLNTVRIGLGNWLPIGEFQGSIEAAQDIDEWVKPTMPFWQHLQLECEIECCGVEALRFDPSDLLQARAKCNDPELMNSLRKLRRNVQDSSEVIFFSSQLCQHFPRPFLVQLLDHIVYYLDSPSNTSQPSS